MNVALRARTTNVSLTQASRTWAQQIPPFGLGRRDAGSHRILPRCLARPVKLNEKPMVCSAKDRRRKAMVHPKPRLVRTPWLLTSGVEPKLSDLQCFARQYSFLIRYPAGHQREDRTDPKRTHEIVARGQLVSTIRSTGGISDNLSSEGLLPKP
jgi:hypothetical protein